MTAQATPRVKCNVSAATMMLLLLATTMVATMSTSVAAQSDEPFELAQSESNVTRPTAVADASEQPSSPSSEASDSDAAIPPLLLIKRNRLFTPHGSVADEAVRANGHLIRQVERIVRDASQARAAAQLVSAHAGASTWSRGDPEPIPSPADSNVASSAAPSTALLFTVGALAAAWINVGSL